MPKYRVLQDVNLNVGVETLRCKEGDVLELTKGQAALHPHYLEPVKRSAKRGSVETKMVLPEEENEE